MKMAEPVLLWPTLPLMRHSEQEIRKKIIEDKVVDVMIAVGPNFSIQFPSCALWFLTGARKY